VEPRVISSRYRLLRRLATGGMGSVYLCEHLTLGRRYALKLLQHAGEASAELAERFQQEARAASRIHHENVVEVLDFGEEPGGDLFYVMELLEGRTLGQLMRQDGPLPLPRALVLLEQVCRALAAAHAQGVVHRDVKPDNVVVERLQDGSERAKLIDFGISHLAGSSRLTRHGEIIGTPEYMAPEQASGTTVDALTDVYAVGVLGFELLTGTLPLLGATPIATLVAHQTQAPPAPSTRRSGLPPEVDALVARALSKERADRFPSMQAMAAEVMRLRLLASMATVSGRGRVAGQATRQLGGWPEAVVSTGPGGTIGLAAVPFQAPADAAPLEASAVPGAQSASWRRRGLVTAVVLALGLAGWLVLRLAPAPGASASPAAAQVVLPPAASPPAPSREEPGPVTAPSPIDEPPAPDRQGGGKRPSRTPSRSDQLRDPYATPVDPLKPDPFR
jgi:serine/threonine-protein kinase